MSSPALPAVAVDGVSKTFRLPHERVHTLKERALHPMRRMGHEAFPALRDVSFAVDDGEFFGIVGRNGSGKSTLLKCLAGIYAVDRGRIYVNGRMSTFIELGVGFNNDLPARDNVMINATMLGLSPREARRRYDAVIDFAELREFEDLKLKNYSSGMEVRLAFSVMMQVDAEVLLIDEVLAVGDAAFQQKCFDEFARIRREGRTVLLVTHDMGNVQRFCDRAMLLERGSIVELGEPDRVAARYLELNFNRGETDDGTPRDESDAGRYGDRRAEIVEAWFEDEAGERAKTVPTGQRAAFCFRARFREPVADPLFGVVLADDRGTPVFEASNVLLPACGGFAAGDEATIRIAFDCVLSSGRYEATPAIARGGSGVAWIDRRERFASVVVTGARSTDAVLDLPFDLEVLSRERR
ncbi:ABC transporter ATP-binding protein [Capillimicrobium parvum]|uniref:Vitamin B12 import ATP-binding protein BtuD n=1 Tax=Capillimicrobium parvum TaxID=2884022 RepID=A0A9E6Y341_9ACTN|nr:ABC transporter ATP-binding protein [Capillimicrobium parvum]UGS38616.1 Vitamin B12 import ATP-binding protein BtuD [Capillimicrobium parvum]